MDNSYTLLAKEVSDLNLLPSILNVGIDGEMGIHQPHFVQEPLGDASDHVLDMSCCGTDGCQVFSLAKMAVNPELFLTLLLKQVQVNCQMLEISLQLSCKKQLLVGLEYRPGG